jgi:hypothetical protein
MSILAARQTPHPGSPITIVETLEPGVNYSRYIAYYESGGLKIYGLLTKPFGKRPEGGWPAIAFNHGYIPPAGRVAAGAVAARPHSFSRSTTSSSSISPVRSKPSAR